MAAKASSGGSKEGPQAVGLQDLNLEQLDQVRQQYQEDLGILAGSVKKLKLAESKFAESINCLKALANNSQGNKLIVQLTSTVSVPGALEDNSKVIVDIGTGYYVSKTIPQAEDFYKRRTEYIQKNLENVENALQAKQQQFRSLNDMIQLRSFLEKQMQQGKAQESP